MIFSALGAFAVGFCQVFLIAFQTRQISAGHKGWLVFVTSCGISSFWCFGVHAVVSAPLVAPFYVLGAATGTQTAMRVKMKVR